MENKYCFKVYSCGEDCDYITYISANSRKEAEKKLKEEYWPETIDYKFLGIE